MNAKPQMRVAIVSHTHPSVSKGGAEIAAYTLFKGLRTLGVPAVFIAAIPHDALPRAVLYTEDERLVPLDPSRYDHNLQLGSPAASQALVDILRAEAVTVVNFHHYLNFGTGVLRAVKQQAGLPVVLTLHEYLAICAHHGQMITRPGRILCDIATPDRCAACFPEAGQAGMATRRDLMLAALQEADAFVSPSHFLIDRYVQWGLPPDRFEMIENGLPGFNPSVPSAPRQKDSQTVFAYFGQINPFKGADVLLDAVDILAKDSDLTGRIQVRIHGNVIGVSPEFEQRLQRATVTHGFLQAPGPYDNRIVHQLMSEADFVMVPSSWWENSPVVIQEAYAAGRPVICSGIGGMAEKVVDGISGFHFRPGSARDLARIMRRVVMEPESRPHQTPIPSSDISMAERYVSIFKLHQKIRLDDLHADKVPVGIPVKTKRGYSKRPSGKAAHAVKD